MNNLHCFSPFPLFISFQIWLEEGGIHHLPVARPNEAVVCLPNGTWAPSVTGKPMQRHEAFTLPAPVRWQRGKHVRPQPVHVSFYMLWNSCSNTTVRHGPLHLAGWVLLSKRKRATATAPQLPNAARTGSVTYVCVVRNAGWVCVFAARQLELGSAASLRGALHGSCVYYTAMAWGLVWQQLTLDLSSPLPGSRAQKHTHTNIQFMHTLRWHFKVPLHSFHTLTSHYIYLTGTFIHSDWQWVHSAIWTQPKPEKCCKYINLII